MLRPGELLALSPELVALPADTFAGDSQFAVVTILQPKNRRQMGQKQFAIIRSENATRWLSWLCSDLPAGGKLWPSTAAEFRCRMKSLAKQLQLESWRILPSCLRPGGTTFFFNLGIEPPRVKFWGRWASERSLNHYIQESIAGMLLLTCSQQVKQRISLLLEAGYFMLNVPTKHWIQFFSRRHISLPLPVAQARSSLQQPRSDKWKLLYM